MRFLKPTRDGISFAIRAALLTTGLLTYLISPDDVVWRFIKARSDARLLEHGAFGVAAALLAIALVLKLKISHDEKLPLAGHVPHSRAVLASLLQSIGIASLLPLPGFLLFVFGDLFVSSFLYRRQSVASGACQKSRWTTSLATHMGLCCALISMVLFSITLIDRVADVLFVLSAVVSILVTFISRHTLLRKAARVIWALPLPDSAMEKTVAVSVESRLSGYLRGNFRSPGRLSRAARAQTNCLPTQNSTNVLAWHKISQV